MDREVKGIWIPIEIWEDKNLSWFEKILFVEIDSFTKQDKDCFFSNEYIADMLGCGIATASKSMAHLIQMGYVRQTKFDGRHRFVVSNMAYQTNTNDTSRLTDSIRQDDKNDMLLNNRINKNNKDRDIDRGRNSQRFVKPTIEEVRDYCWERGNIISASEFYDHYEANGWMVGKAPMKDWKAAVRTWEAKRTSQPQRKGQPKEQESVYAHAQKVLRELGIANG